MSRSDLQKIAEATYLLPKEQGMLVPGLVIATEELLNVPEFERPLEQVRNVAYLPGIVGYSIAMPDIHWGYGFPIGGVAATDAEMGVISPGGVGYDINCGVRLAIVSQPFKDLTDKQKSDLLRTIYQFIPSGVGKGTNRRLTSTDYHKIVDQGAKWSISQGYGLPRDLDYMESNGYISGGDIEVVSNLAKDRGRDQLGTIGSGNHFVEIGEVQKIFLPAIAKAWNINPGDIYIMIHSGSRGFGHQVCQDTLNTFISLGYHKNLPDRQLVAAPIKSDVGKNYFSAMAAAANFAFNNRQQILHAVRQSFEKVLNIGHDAVRLLYDVCHNIAKFEEHEVEGVKRKLCVHRKGATRAFGPKHKELSPLFQETGQPVLVPGDMGRASYLMVGSGNPITWCSACHGAGRAKSRVQSMKDWRGKNLERHMHEQGVLVVARTMRTVAEEMPDAYKNVDDVVQAVEQAHLASIVARLKPHLVLKG